MVLAAPVENLNEARSSERVKNLALASFSRIFSISSEQAHASFTTVEEGACAPSRQNTMTKVPVIPVIDLTGTDDEAAGPSRAPPRKKSRRTPYKTPAVALGDDSSSDIELVESDAERAAGGAEAGQDAALGDADLAIVTTVGEVSWASRRLLRSASPGRSPCHRPQLKPPALRAHI